MSDEIPRALTEMWREVPVGTAPLAKIERDLKARSETHKRRLMVAGAVAGVAVVAVAAAVFQVGGGSGSRTEAAGPAPAVDGMRYFGMNDVVAAVPDTWAQQEPVCSTPTNPYVYFRSSAIYNCPREKPTAHSLPVDRKSVV